MGEHLDPEDKEGRSLVTPVKKGEVMNLIDKIVYFCQVKGIPHVEVEDIIFKKFTLAGKVTIEALSKILQEKFQFEETEALLLSRYMIEQEESILDGSGIND